MVDTEQLDTLLLHARIPPYQHQRVGVEKLVEKPVFFLADEMGAGKTKQVIDAMQVLFALGQITKVLVVAPATVRAVWFDKELGELQKHLWTNTPASITEYHAKRRQWMHGPEDAKITLQIVITNYDFIRSAERLAELKQFCDSKTLLVLDESSAVKNYRAKQTKSCLVLRRACGRVVLLNGTPIANSPLDMYSQGNIMDPRILNCQTFFHFRSKYAILGGFQAKQIVGWQNLEEMQQRFAPYVLRRLKTDCLDLPEKLPAVVLTVPLDDETWRVYRQMRDEMVSWLSESTVAVAAQAVVKAMRLAQITSGFLGGVQDPGLEGLPQDLLDSDTTDRPDWLVNTRPAVDDSNYLIDTRPLQPLEGQEIKYLPPQEIGREKLDAFLTWFEEKLVEDKNMKILVWCRFRPELARLMRSMMTDERFKNVHLGEIHGGQKRADREVALRLLDPRTMPKGPVLVGGTPASGSMGLNLTASSTVVYMSNDYSLKTRLQSEDRVHRPGQKFPCSYFDVVATGPAGQKTIDHAIIKALRNKENLANFTTKAWISALKEE